MSTDISRAFQIFVKPVGAVCNLACDYCYYLDKRNLYGNGGLFHMTDELLEQYIMQHIEASTEKVIIFSWHGGEPTLAGIDFFRKIVQLQRNHQPKDRTIVNGIQTNGILIDNEWCRFFRKEKFLVGISMDGPGFLHNRYRVNRKKRPSFDDVIKGYYLLQKHNITTEILCVVNAENVQYPLESYHFFKQLKARFITFLPLVERDQDVSGVSLRSVPAEAFGIFMSSIFDEWVRLDIGKIKIQLFEEAARTAFDQEHTLCIFKETCGGVPVLEFNGDLYSCDHFVDQDHLVGNIRQTSLSDMLDSRKQLAFGLAKRDTLPAYCLSCEVKDMCNGECPKNRFIYTPDGEPGLNYLCKGYKLFFNHCKPFVNAVREQWKKQQ